MLAAQYSTSCCTHWHALVMGLHPLSCLHAPTSRACSMQATLPKVQACLSYEDVHTIRSVWVFVGLVCAVVAVFQLSFHSVPFISLCHNAMHVCPCGWASRGMHGGCQDGGERLLLRPFGSFAWWVSRFMGSIPNSLCLIYQVFPMTGAAASL